SVLVLRGPSYFWNPSLDREQLEREQARDPRRYRREIECEFIDAVACWIEGEHVEAATARRDEQPIPPQDGVVYAGGIDIAFKRDACVFVVRHLDQQTGTEDDAAPMFTVDGVWRWQPVAARPLDSELIVREVANVCGRYRLTSVLGDQFAAIPMRDAFRRKG